MNLETERLILRNFRENDLEDFVEYRAAPQVCIWQGISPITRKMPNCISKNKSKRTSAIRRPLSNRRRTQKRRQDHRRHSFENGKRKHATSRVRHFVFSRKSRERSGKRSLYKNFRLSVFREKCSSDFRNYRCRKCKL